MDKVIKTLVLLFLTLGILSQAGVEASPLKVTKVLSSGKIVPMNVSWSEVGSSTDPDRICHFLRFKDSDMTPQWNIKADQGEISDLEISIGSVQFCLYSKNAILQVTSPTHHERSESHYLIDELERAPLLIAPSCEALGLKVTGEWKDQFHLARVECEINPQLKSSLNIHLKTNLSPKELPFQPKVQLSAGEKIQLGPLSLHWDYVVPQEVPVPSVTPSPTPALVLRDQNVHSGFRFYLGAARHSHENQFSGGVNNRNWTGNQVRLQVDHLWETSWWKDLYVHSNLRTDFLSKDLSEEHRLNLSVSKTVFRLEENSFAVGLGVSTTMMPSGAPYGLIRNLSPLLELSWVKRQNLEVRFGYAPFFASAFEFQSALFELTALWVPGWFNQHLELGLSANQIKIGPQVSGTRFTFMSNGIAAVIGWRL